MARLALRDFGTSLNFAGSSSNKVDAPYTFPTDAFSVSFWYKTSLFGSNAGLFEQAGSFTMRRQGSNAVECYAYLNAPITYASPRRVRFNYLTAPTADQRWHHRVINVYVSAGVALLDQYEDGAAIQIGAGVDYTGDTSTPSGTLQIGRSIAAGQNFNGLMDSVTIYNRKLSASEIASLYQSGTDPVAAGAKWTFNEGAGSTAADSSGNGNNGTITGAVYTADVPMKTRKFVSGNILFNGDFEFPSTGTVGNPFSPSSNLNGIYQDVANLTGAIDASTSHSGTQSLRLTFTSASGLGAVFMSQPGTGRKYQIFPNTSYTLSGWVKTNNIAAARPVAISIRLYDPQGASFVSGFSCSGISGTIDWTKYSVTFTTPSNAGSYDITFYNDYGNTSDRNAGSTANFDDITLIPTVDVVRLPA